jgi:hypothetical protein
MILNQYPHSHDDKFTLSFAIKQYKFEYFANGPVLELNLSMKDIKAQDGTHFVFIDKDSEKFTAGEELVDKEDNRGNEFLRLNSDV